MATETHVTQSIAFPKMFDTTRNVVRTYEGNKSIVNRDRLLILSNPNELYNEPDFGVGLPRHLWKYNTPNTKAIVQKDIREQLRLHEPCVDADKTTFADGLLFTDTNVDETVQENQQSLKMTVGLSTIYEDTTQLTLNLEEESGKIFDSMIQDTSNS